MPVHVATHADGPYHVLPEGALRGRLPGARIPLGPDENLPLFALRIFAVNLGWLPGGAQNGYLNVRATTLLVTSGSTSASSPKWRSWCSATAAAPPRWC